MPTTWRTGSTCPSRRASSAVCSGGAAPSSCARVASGPEGAGAPRTKTSFTATPHASAAVQPVSRSAAPLSWTTWPPASVSMTATPTYARQASSPTGTTQARGSGGGASGSPSPSPPANPAGRLAGAWLTGGGSLLEGSPCSASRRGRSARISVSSGSSSAGMTEGMVTARQGGGPEAPAEAGGAMAGGGSDPSSRDAGALQEQWSSRRGSRG